VYFNTNCRQLSQNCSCLMLTDACYMRKPVNGNCSVKQMFNNFVTAVYSIQLCFPVMIIYHHEVTEVVFTKKISISNHMVSDIHCHVSGI
jgi:hypothetical protein